MSTTTMPNTSELRHAVNGWLGSAPGRDRQRLVTELGIAINPGQLDDFLDRPMVPLGTNLRIKLVRFVEGLDNIRVTGVNMPPEHVETHEESVQRRRGRPPGSKNAAPSPPPDLPEGFVPVVLMNYGKASYSHPGITIHKDFQRSALNVPLYGLMGSPTAMAFGARYEGGKVAELVLVPCIPETPNATPVGADRYIGKRIALFFQAEHLPTGFHRANRAEDGTWRIVFPREIEPQFP